MTKFIRKIFIKNYEDVTNQKVRTDHGILASIVGIVTNLLLFAFKLIIGILTFSISVISDAINNLTDLFSCFVNLIGFKVASKPADKDHPFGHERVEYVSALIISFVIVGASVLLIYSSITTLVEANLELNITIWTFVILSVSIVAKIFLGLFYWSMGKAINSVSLKAAMKDSLNDVVITLFVLIISIINFYMPELWYLDPIASILIALVILIAGIKMIKEASSPLIGIRPDENLVKNIKEELLKFNNVLGVHDMLFHSYGPTKTYLSLHVETYGNMNLFEAHEIADEIENYLKDKYSINAIVHMDPVDVESKLYKEVKEYLENILNRLDKNLKFHDLRVNMCKNKKCIAFDIELNDSCKENKENLSKTIIKELNSYYTGYEIVINYDDNYIG